jgi:hypothetical protein
MVTGERSDVISLGKRGLWLEMLRRGLFPAWGRMNGKTSVRQRGSRLGSIVQIRFKATARKERRMRSTQQSAASLIQALGSWSGSEFGVLARGPLSRLVVVDEAQPTTRTEHRASRP